MYTHAHTHRKGFVYFLNFGRAGDYIKQDVQSDSSMLACPPGLRIVASAWPKAPHRRNKAETGRVELAMI